MNMPILLACPFCYSLRFEEKDRLLASGNADEFRACDNACLTAWRSGLRDRLRWNANGRVV